MSSTTQAASEMVSHKCFQVETTNEKKVHIISNVFERDYLIDIKTNPSKKNPNI